MNTKKFIHRHEFMDLIPEAVRIAGSENKLAARMDISVRKMRYLIKGTRPLNGTHVPVVYRKHDLFLLKKVIKGRL